jgi:hypothetical protein
MLYSLAVVLRNVHMQGCEGRIDLFSILFPYLVSWFGSMVVP